MHDRADVSDSFTQLVACFERELAEVSFPAVDLAILRQAAAEHEDRCAALTEAELALEAARAALAEQDAELTGLRGRALAYAKIYARDDAALLEELEGLAPKRKATRRSRPKASRPSTRKAKGAAGGVDGTPTVVAVERGSLAGAVPVEVAQAS